MKNILLLIMTILIGLPLFAQPNDDSENISDHMCIFSGKASGEDFFFEEIITVSNKDGAGDLTKRYTLENGLTFEVEVAFGIIDGIPRLMMLNLNHVESSQSSSFLADMHDFNILSGAITMDNKKDDFQASLVCLP